MKTANRISGREKLLNEVTAGGEKVERRLKSMLAAQAGTHHVTLSQLSAMRAIDLHGSLNSRQLGKLLFITSGAVTQLVDSLVSENFVERQPDPADRRITNLLLTQAGKQKLYQLQEERTRLFEAIHHTLTDDELTVLSDIQSQMLRAMDTLESKKTEK